MRRIIILAVVLALSVTLPLSGALAVPVAAQDSTPEAGAPAVTQTELAPGVIAEVFAGVPSARAPGQTVYLVRLSFEPGSEAAAHGHPGTTVLAIDSGTLGFTLQQGTVHVVRGAGTGATEAEVVSEAGAEISLNPGDAIYYEDDVIHSVRNAGDEPASVLATLVLEAGQPLLLPAEMEMAATPTP